MRFSCISGNYSKLTNNGEGWSRLLKNADRRIVVITGRISQRISLNFFITRELLPQLYRVQLQYRQPLIIQLAISCAKHAHSTLQCRVDRKIPPIVRLIRAMNKTKVASRKSKACYRLPQHRYRRSFGQHHRSGRLLFQHSKAIAIELTESHAYGVVVNRIY